jgi:HAD superfamily hydrolase (TIGR01509 family)
MTIRAVAWDIDGTLVDSEPLHERALLEVCGSFGLDTAELGGNRFRGIHMNGVWTHLEPLFPAGVTREEWQGRILEIYCAFAHTLGPLPGALEAMAALRVAGVPQVCVSNSERVVVDANIAALGLAEFIDFSISFDDVENGKPHPEPYATAAERLGLAPGIVAAVEDSATGAASAKAAGMRVFGVLAEGGPLPHTEVTVATIDDLMVHLAPGKGG